MEDQLWLGTKKGVGIQKEIRSSAKSVRCDPQPERWDRRNATQTSTADHCIKYNFEGSSAVLRTDGRTFRIGAGAAGGRSGFAGKAAPAGRALLHLISSFATGFR